MIPIMFSEKGNGRRPLVPVCKIIATYFHKLFGIYWTFVYFLCVSFCCSSKCVPVSVFVCILSVCVRVLVCLLFIGWPAGLCSFLIPVLSSWWPTRRAGSARVTPPITKHNKNPQKQQLDQNYFCLKNNFWKNVLYKSDYRVQSEGTEQDFRKIM